MTTPRPKAKAAAPAPLPAITKPNQDEVTAILQRMGMVEAPREEFHRIKVDGAVFDVDGVPYVSNPRTNTPAFLGRIIAPPEQYQALWHDSELAKTLDRPDAADKFCKSFFNDPEQGRKYSNFGYSCEACPVSPFKKDNPYGVRCSWKGDVQLQLVDPATMQFYTKLDDAGTTIPDETIYTLTLSTTAMIEWQGTSRDPKAGNVSPSNFIHQLANLGMEQSPDDPNAGIVRAINALGLGLVVAEWRSLKASNSSGSNTWYVPSATPILILDYEETIQQLPAETSSGATEDDLNKIDLDDIPF